MKSLRRLLLTAMLCAGSCPELAVFPADPPAKVAVVKTAKQAIPQVLLDALEKCEKDRLDNLAADVSLAVANAAVEQAAKQKADAQAAAAIDYANFLRLWAEIYGTGPAPQPPTPPQPPPVPPTPPTPPTPPPVVLPALTLVTATGNWCLACTQTEGDTVPALKANAGITFKSILYTDAEAAKVFPQSALVPRWVLTWPDGKVEKKIGYLTVDQVNQWIGKGAKP